MIYSVIPNYFNDYLAKTIWQSLNPLYLFTHKKKPAKLTDFNLLITNKNNAMVQLVEQEEQHIFLQSRKIIAYFYLQPLNGHIGMTL